MAGDAIFVVEPVGWNKAFKSSKGEVGRHMKKTMTKQILLSRKSAPAPGTRPRNRTGINYSTGLLRASIFGRQTRWKTELEVQVHAMSYYALYVHNGTKPHPITPKKAGGALRFYWHRIGRTIVVKEIKMHPGTRPIPFLSENLRSAVR